MERCNIYIGKKIAEVMAEKKSRKQKWLEDWRLDHKASIICSAEKVLIQIPYILYL